MFRESALAKIDVHYDEHIWPVLSRENALPRLVDRCARDRNGGPWRVKIRARYRPAARRRLLYRAAVHHGSGAGRSRPC